MYVDAATTYVDAAYCYRLSSMVTWKEVVQKDCQARNLNNEDAIDRGRWKKLIEIG